MTKYIFVTGGIVSGLGKGITAASLGRLLLARGYSVGMLKIDPYLNRDAGTMNPFQHGEVFVTDDGAETDLDLGHYERFTGLNLSQLANFTTGTVYSAVTNSERKGDFLGSTIQIIPHVTDEIKRRIRLAGKGKDFLLVEIGGTVGDIEGAPFLEAARQLKGEEQCIFIHVVKIDYIYPSDEEKTKPIQHSVVEMRSLGLQPQMLVVRCKREIEENNRKKIALFCDVKLEKIIPAPNANSLYEIPLNLEKESLADEVLSSFEIKNGKPNLTDWQKLASQIKKSQKGKTIRIGMVGKYLHHPDAYISVVEALRHAAIATGVGLEIVPVDSENLLKSTEPLKILDGILVPGGFGMRGIEGKIVAIKYAREHKIPYLGLCLGMQVAVIEFARNVCGLEDANSTEFNSKTKYPVIDLLPEQKNISKMGGTMRLGVYPCKIKKDTLVSKLYGRDEISERHRHRYEFNNKYREALEKKGLVISGIYPKKNLVEIIELPDHPFFIASQFHPEFKSNPLRPHPLFLGFIKAALR